MTALQSSITTTSQTYFQKQKPFVHQDQVAPVVPENKEEFRQENSQ